LTPPTFEILKKIPCTVCTRL